MSQPKSIETKISESALLAIESQLISLQVLKQYITPQFSAAVSQVYYSGSRLVVTGIGKSAIIGQKIVATLNSTGQPAIFMHAADAIHGDLGMIQEKDVVLAISKSGNTPEIKALAPLLKRFGNALIAMVGNTKSELAQIADYVIDTTIDKEACPNNLAPTTSTTAQLIMGDAIAIALLTLRNFGSEDFGKYHPGGALGKKIYLRCADLLQKENQPHCYENTDVANCIQHISKGRMGAVVVIDSQQIPIGIVTDGDVRRMLQNDLHNIQNLMAKDIMSLHPKTIESTELASKAAFIMQENKISQIVVTDNEKYVGMIHFHDLNKEGII